MEDETRLLASRCIHTKWHIPCHFGLFQTISEFGLSFESKRELSVSNGMINFAFHKIHDESNVVKKLERRWAGCGEGERQEHLK